MKVKISDLYFEADQKSYFKNLTIEFEKKQFIGITSPTKMDRLDFLMDMIFGLYLPTQGEVLWNDQNIYYNTQVRENSYYVSSRWMPPLFLRVCDYVDTKNISPQIKLLFEKNNINPKTKLSELNARQFFSLYCAQAIASKPDVIMIDFFGANFRSSDEPWVFAELEQLKEHSIIILKMDSTSKNIRFCDKLYFFDTGEISHQIDTKQAVELYVVYEGDLPSDQTKWLKIPGTENRHIAKKSDLKNHPPLTNLLEPNLEDVTKLYLMENYYNGTFKKTA